MATPVYKVFISYKRKTGEDFALHLREGLEGERISAFLDIKDIPRRFVGMSEWWKFRDKAISQSETFLLIVTDGIETSAEVVKEFSYANQKNIECIFLRHKGLQPRIIMDIDKRKIDLADFNQTEFETKEDLLRKVLRILRETSRVDNLREKAIPVGSTVFSEGKSAGGLFGELLKKAVSTEEIVGKLEDHEVDFLRGRWFYHNKNYDRALTLFDRSLAFKPDFVPCLIDKGIVLGLLGKPEEALNWFDNAIELEPDSSLAFALKGTVLGSLERYGQAIDNYDKSIELRPIGSVYYNKGVALDALGRYSEAIACYEKAIEIDPTDESCWHNKAFSLLKLKRYEESVACCDKALEITPTALSWALKGIALVNLGRIREAKYCYDEALKIETIPVILIQLSEILLIMGNIQEGLVTAERAFHLSENVLDRVLAWFLRITAYFLGGETEKVQIETRRLVKFLRLEREVKTERALEDEVTFLLIQTVRERLKENEKNDLLSLVSLLKKEIGWEDFWKRTSSLHNRCE